MLLVLVIMSATTPIAHKSLRSMEDIVVVC